MHELSLAEELVARCAELAGGRRVVQVRARASFGVDEQELSEAFLLAAAGGTGGGGGAGGAAAGAGGALEGAAGGALAGAVLELQLVPARLECPCGWAGELPDDYVVGHIGVCPGCGRAAELPGGLEVVGLRFAGEGEAP